MKRRLCLHSVSWDSGNSLHGSTITRFFLQFEMFFFASGILNALLDCVIILIKLIKRYY